MTTTVDHPDELLPWYANGSLDGAERQQVEAHLAACERCRHELEVLKALREQVRAETVQPPTEFGLKRLLRDVRKENDPPARQWWRPALAAAALVIVIQGILLVNLWPRDTVYTPLGGAERAELQVRFRPEASEEQIRAALNAVGARIVGGPGALGIYRLRIEGGDEDPQRVVAAEADLKERTEVVEQVNRE